MYRNENLSMNMTQVVDRSDLASRQMKELVDILRKINGNHGPPPHPDPKKQSLSQDYQVRDHK